MAARAPMPWAHRVFSPLKRRGTVVSHRFRRPRPQAPLDGFACRMSRRDARHTGLDRLLRGLGALPYRGHRGSVPKAAAAG
jgi:hypothetical protein